jgi:hypothetical protein
MTLEKNKDKVSRRRSIFKIIGLTLYLALFFYLFYLLVNFGLNPIIVSFLLIFIILITITPFFRRNKQGFYSKMFSGAKKAGNAVQTRKTDMREIQKSESKIPEPISIEFEYRKPLIDKCKNCGNIVPNFVKKCPFCSKTII